MGKKKAGKLPKEVLGVKVPKELRKAGERLIEHAQGPAGRQAIAGALTAMAGAAVSAALARGAAAAAAPTGTGTGTGAGAPSDAVPPREHDLGGALARVADAFFANLTERNR